MSLDGGKLSEGRGFDVVVTRKKWRQRYRGE